MNPEVTIPNGDDTIVLELTVKEAFALSGARFNQNPHLLGEARKKVLKSLDHKLIPSSQHLQYHELEIN